MNRQSSEILQQEGDAHTAQLNTLRSSKNRVFCSRKLKTLAKQAGFRIGPGGKHLAVYWDTQRVVSLPHVASGSDLTIKTSNDILAHMIEYLERRQSIEAGTTKGK